MSIENIRNIAIIAHVDHGKTTLVDKLLQQSGTLDRKNMDSERIMDSNDQEKERGITITAKNTSINWNNHLINIVDTPGHADFGGEVERALSMVDSVLLLVDAVDGPMPQTRFVTQKAFEKGLNPIVVINKVDRPDARPHWVLDQVFDLFDRLGGTDEQLDFPVIYASAIEGISGLEPENMTLDMTTLMQMILDKVPAPEVNINGPLQLQISALDSNSYVGVIGIGRIKQGVIKPNDQVVVVNREGETRKGKVLQVMGYEGLDRVEVNKAEAGSIVCITGIDKLNISDTICDPSSAVALPALSVDEPTVSMTFQVNDSPFVGKEGIFEKYNPEVIFGLHVSNGPHGYVGFAPGPAMAAASAWRVTINGVQSHGSRPWEGIDPIMALSQFINQVNTIVSRRVNIVGNPAVVSVGMIEAGTRNNIIPEEAIMIGTIRTFDPELRKKIYQEISQIAKGVETATGTSIKVEFDVGGFYPVTFNNIALGERMKQSLIEASNGNFAEISRRTGAEDFSYFSQEIPGLYIFLGVNDPDKMNQAGNHSPYFTVNDDALDEGLRSLIYMTIDY